MEAVVEAALDRANGDLELALKYLGEDVVLFSGEVIVLERDVQIANNTVAVLQEYKEAVEPGFLEKLSNSTVFKVTLFVGGVWLGREMVKVQ